MLLAAPSLPSLFLWEAALSLAAMMSAIPFGKAVLIAAMPHAIAARDGSTA
jgi:hypothetical protein